MSIPKVSIAFYSRNFSTEAPAIAVGKGAASKGAGVRLRRARELVSEDVMPKAPGWVENSAAMNSRYPAPSEDDAEWADAIIFGSPTRFGLIASELMAYLDALGGLWFQGKLNGKVGSAFGSISSVHGGNESTLTSLFAPMAHLGMIIVPLGYANPVLFRAGTPYGATHASRGDTVVPTDDELEVARFQGKRVASIPRLLTAPVSGTRFQAEAEI